MSKRYFVFAISLFINAFGNSLMLKGGVGASPWTAAFDNVSVFFHITPGTAANLIFFCLYTASKIIGKDFSLKKTSLFVVITIFYGFVCDGFLWIIGPDQLSNMLLNYVLAITGALTLALSISLSIKANAIFLALDDFLKNTKKHIFNGNIKKASFLSNSIALLTAVFFGLLYGQIHNVTFLTFIITFVFGMAVSFFDRIINIKFEDKDDDEKDNDYLIEEISNF